MTGQDTTATHTIGQYRKKPVVIEAVQLTWATWSEVCDFVNNTNIRGVFLHPTDNSVFSDKCEWGNARIAAFIYTLEGEMFAVEGDYIIKGVAGEFYPCKPDIFEQTYEAVMVDTDNTKSDNVRSSEPKCKHMYFAVIQPPEGDKHFQRFPFCGWCGEKLEHPDYEREVQS